MFLIISDLTIVEYSNAAICEQATPAPAMLCTNNSATITHPKPRVQVVDHSFSGYA